jgi:hypothetical protein
VKNLVFENGQVPVGTLKDFYFLLPMLKDLWN